MIIFKELIFYLLIINTVNVFTNVLDIEKNHIKEYNTKMVIL